MMFALGITDNDWFYYLRDENPTETVNFWTPTNWRIQAKPGTAWYFMLHAPLRKLGGYGLVQSYELMSINEAWSKFGFRNGCKSRFELGSRIRKYAESRSTHWTLDQIGCLELANCVFWDNSEFVTPENYGVVIPNPVTKFKYFDFDPPFRFPQSVVTSAFNLLGSSDIESVTRSSVKRRDGQSDFKAMIMRAYASKCCITGETCPELLETAHIQPYINKQSNHPQNGLLLRVDFHKLYDNGLLYIDETYQVLMSSQVCEC